MGNRQGIEHSPGLARAGTHGYILVWRHEGGKWLQKVNRLALGNCLFNKNYRGIQPILVGSWAGEWLSYRYSFPLLPPDGGSPAKGFHTPQPPGAQSRVKECVWGEVGTRKTTAVSLMPWFTKQMLWNFSQDKEILFSRQLQEEAYLWFTAVASGLNPGPGLWWSVNEGLLGSGQRLREGQDVASARLQCWSNKTELMSPWLCRESGSLCRPYPDESLREWFSDCRTKPKPS